MRGFGATFLVLCALLLAMGAPAAATTDAVADSTEVIPSGIPELGGHRFVPTPLVPSPFIHSFFRNSLGMGSAKDVETTPFIFNGQPVLGLKGDVSAVGLGFEYQLALKRWLAVRAQFKIAGQFGTGVQTLLAEGVGTSTDLQFGWVFALHQGEHTQLAGSLMVTNRTVTGFSVLNLVSDIINGTNLGLSHKTPVLNAVAGLRWAWAASDLVGVSLSGGVGSGETLDRNKGGNWFYSSGLAVSFDLDQYDLPLGAALSGTLDNFGGEGAAERATAVEVGIRLSYIGRESFVLSVDLSWAQVPSTAYLEGFNASWTGLTVQYYF